MHNYIGKDFDIPFTNGNKWIQIYLYNNKHLTIELIEIYNVKDKEAQKVLGYTDSREFFSIGFRIPFRKEKKTLDNSQ